VSEFEQEEEEQVEEDRIGDVVSNDSEDSDDDQGGRVAMPTPVVPWQYRFMLCPHQFQLWYFMPCRLRAG
jgi:hypothetical protein